MKSIIILICSIFFTAQNLNGQIFLNNSSQEIIDHFEWDSTSIKWAGNTLSFPLDSMNSGIAEFKFKDEICYQYKFELNCQECYDSYLFALTKDYYSDWIQYNDSTYFLKKGSLGWEKTMGEIKVYYVPKMTLNFDKSNGKCLTATITNENIEELEYNKRYKQLFQKVSKTKVKKRLFNGTWKIQFDSLYPTTIETLDVLGKSIRISFSDKTKVDYTIKWISCNAFQLWYFETKTNDFEIYLTCEIMSISEGELQVWFYDESAKYHQTMTKSE